MPDATGGMLWRQGFTKNYTGAAADPRKDRNGVLKLLREMDEPVEKHCREMLKHAGQEKLGQLFELLERRNMLPEIKTQSVRSGQYV